MSMIRTGGARIFLRLLSGSTLRMQAAAEPEKNLSVHAPTGRPPVPATATRKAHFIRATLPSEGLTNWELERKRVVPTLKTFYGGNPVHEENINELNAIIRRHVNLPTRIVDEKEAKITRFLSFEEYQKRSQSGTRIKEVHHRELVQLLNRLRSIEPELMPKDVIDTLQKFSHSSNVTEAAQQHKAKTLDEFGRANTVGRRKRSEADVALVKGEGLVLVNGRTISEYFVRVIDRQKIAYPFQVVSQEGQYNVFVTVLGGGISAQAEAVKYGIAKALVVFNPLLKPRLSKAGLMTRDARKVERKKPGKLKARKSPTWVKR